MNFILILITRHGATSLTSRGKLKIMESMLHKVMNCTISHTHSSMIIHIPLNIKQLHNSINHPNREEEEL
jgi:competence protein ComGF